MRALASWIDAQNQVRIAYQIRHLLGLCLPDALFRGLRPLITAKAFPDKAGMLRRRLDYYNRIDQPFTLDAEVQPFQLQLAKGQSTYQLDLHDALRYFPESYRVAYEFGDVTRVPNRPTLVKSRPVQAGNHHAVLFNLNRIRHFYFVNDRRRFEDKRNVLVWRGRACQAHRKAFLERFYNHPLCDVGHYHARHQDVPWTKPRLSIEQQLAYKFIFVIEGNDVASSLKWTLSSRSLCVMAKPRFETWFMEGQLEPGRHYVQVRDDYADLDEKVTYYRDHPRAALAIIEAANRWVDQFRDPRIERLLALLVLWRYFHASGQCDIPPPLYKA